MSLPLGDFDLSPFAVITRSHDCNSFQWILPVPAIYQTWRFWRPLNMQYCVILSLWVWIGLTVSFLAKKISQKCWDVHSEISLYVGWGFHLGCCFLYCLPREKTAVMSWDTSKEKLTYESPATTYMYLEVDLTSVDSLTAIPQETLSQRYSVKLCSDSRPGNGEIINFVVLSC